MGCALALGVLVAASPAAAVNQADFWWQKKLATTMLGDNILPPMFQPNGDIVVVSASEPLQYEINYFTGAGAVKHTVVGKGEPGAAAMDRQGRLYVAIRNGRETTVSRFTAEGQQDFQKLISGAASALPIGLLAERSGDLFVAGVGQPPGLGFLGRTDADGGTAWGSFRGKAPGDAWSPVKMAVFQTGNILVAGDARREDGTSVPRLVKVSADGKEMFAVDLPGEGTVVACGIDADSNIVAVTKPSAGGAIVWSLEGARGLVRWKDERMATPEIKPVALLIDPRKFIHLLLDNTEEGKTRAYVVRYSLGGEALTNFRPTDEVSHAASICQDENGEIYIACTGGPGTTGAALVFRSASHLLSRYAIRYHFPHPYEAKHVAVRDADGAGVVLGLAGDPAAGRSPILLKFRQAPVAKYETFKVPAGTVFDSPNSVLGNDQYVEGALMQLTAQPKNGSLEFRKDGTFRYTPNGGFKGKDTFRYQLSRGQLFWYAAVVTLEVE